MSLCYLIPPDTWEWPFNPYLKTWKGEAERFQSVIGWNRSNHISTLSRVRVPREEVSVRPLDQRSWTTPQAASPPPFHWSQNCCQVIAGGHMTCPRPLWIMQLEQTGKTLGHWRRQMLFLTTQFCRFLIQWCWGKKSSETKDDWERFQMSIKCISNEKVFRSIVKERILINKGQFQL